MFKRNLLRLLCLLVLTGIGTSALAVNESEPNDVWNQADVITLGATGTGTAGVSQNQDWWRVTSAVDGKLTINWTATNALYVWCQVYDTLGVLQFNTGSSYTNSSSVLNVDGLAPGTYYIKFYAYYTNEAPGYSFIASWTAPAQGNDAEPNGTKGQAKTLALNGSVTGHVGYYYNNLRDTLDWWKVTTNKDGQLNFTITAHNSQYVYAELFDNDGVTFLAGSNTNGVATYNKDGLAVGTYYIRVKIYYSDGFIPYTLSNTLTLPPVPIDVEPNDKKSQAKTINPNDSITGHVGYYYNHKRDTFDYRKVTLTSDGRLDWTISSLNGDWVFAQLFDIDATTLLAGNYTNTIETYSKEGLAAGTYYLKIYSYYASHFEPYYLKTKFYPSASDHEPNGTYATAATLSLNDSLKGHSSYFYNGGSRDTADWFKLTTNNDGQLNIRFYSLNNDWVYLTVYDKNGTTVLFGPTYTDTNLVFIRNDAAKGTYYVKVQAYAINNFVNYALVNSLINNNPNDPEPDNYANIGNKINGYTTRTGNINYRQNGGGKDAVDWWKIGYYALGNLDITVSKVQHTFDSNYPNIVYRLYSDTTLAPLDSVALTGGANLTYNHVYNGLSAGTYYIRITQLNNTFGGYSIKANYRDTTSQTVTLISDVAGTTCGAGALTYYITRGKPPYAVQLYKDGVASGAAINTSDTAKFTSLNAGYYSVTTRSTTAAAYTVSGVDTTVVPKPVGLATPSLTTTSAILKWTGLPCVDGYRLQWRLKGTTAWTTILQPAGATQDTIYGLAASTQYQFRVTAYVLYNGNTKYYGLVSTVKTFTTPAVRLADNTDNVTMTEMEVFPNPVLDKINFVVDDSSPVMQITVSNAIGQQVIVINNNVDLNQAVDVSSLQRGIYFVTIKTSANLYTARFVKE